MSDKISLTRRKKKEGGLGETLRTIVYAVAIALVVRTVAFEPFNIPSESMMPTLLVGDYLFVSKYAYGYSHHSLPFGVGQVWRVRVLERVPERGDIAVFKLPRDNATDYIKRVIGLPGDRIQVKGGQLFINDEPVKRERIADFLYQDRFGRSVLVPQYRETLPSGRSYLTLDLEGSSEYDDTPVYTVQPGHYFALGDNRDNSLDSRVKSGVGQIPAENLVGRAEFLFFSTDAMGEWWEIWSWLGGVRFARLFRGLSG
ncbi:MAG: signal peptidase I [Alphaproteobacteria bacterium]|nr:signal peptidase I [Alphaproteobacteria bacterium]